MANTYDLESNEEVTLNASEKEPKETQEGFETKENTENYEPNSKKIIKNYQEYYNYIVKKYYEDEIEKILFLGETRTWGKDSYKVYNKNWVNNFNLIISSTEASPALTFAEKNQLLTYQKWFSLSDELCSNESFYNNFKGFVDTINTFQSFFANADLYFS